MPINENMNITISYVAPRVGNISKKSDDITIIDTSHNVIVIPITRDWKTPAASSNYGTLYIKPTLNVYDEIMANGGFISGKKYQFVVAPDVALIADNTNVGAIHGDARVPTGVLIEVLVEGLALGRGGLGADLGFRYNVAERRIEKGGDGGPAVTSVQPLKVIVSGGLAGGGGGGGASGYYWNSDDYYTTSQTEYWWVGPKYPIDSGAGAPFGLRTEPATEFGSMEELVHKNKDVLYNVSDAPESIITRQTGNMYVTDRDFILISMNPRDAKFTAYVNPSLDPILAIDKPITHFSRWYTNFRQNAIDANHWNGYSQLARVKDEEVIKAKLVWLNANDRYGYSQGGTVPSVGYAGLFKGASAAAIGRNTHSYSDWAGSFLCQPQSFIDARVDRLKGSKGGSLGQVGEDGPMPMAITSHTGYTNGNWAALMHESLDGIQGWNRKNNKNNSETVIPVGGGVGGIAGPSFRGAVTVTVINSGVIGGVDVANKYDPNGDYDYKARGNKNHGKTFEGKWYVA